MVKRIIPGTDEEILADWDTGDYSKDHGGLKTQRDLSHKHNCSIGRVNKLVKGREPKNFRIVNNLIIAKQELAAQNEKSVNAVQNLVDERTKHIQIINDLAIKNAIRASDLLCETQQDHERLSNTILRTKEVVIGKAPETAIQINNSNEGQKVRSLADFYALPDNG